MRRPAVLLALVAGAILLSASPAAAHPLGNFTVNRYAGLTLMPKEVHVLYVVDMAEIPTFQELPTIDTNGDGTESASELQSWADLQAASVIPGLKIEVGGAPVRLGVADATASFRPGQGGLRCLRLETTLSGAADAKTGTMTFSDTNELDRIGWREITAVGANGVALRDSSVPTASVSDTLLSYPVDLLSSPLSVRSMSARFAPGTSADAGSPAGPSSAALQQSGRPLVESGAFAALVASRGLPLMALGMLLAISFGAWHALLPGHGKTLVAAAVVGSSARVRQTIVASIAVAVMHTASVIGLGLLILMLEQTFRPETLYPWLGMASGLAAVGIGVHLVLARVRSLRHRDHRSEHSHDHGHEHGHDHEHEHEHEHDARTGGFLSRRGIAALAFAGGILPAPSALVVMLASVQLRRTVYGLTLIAAFSVGLAVTLMVVGLSAARAGAALNRRSSVLARVLPVLSASAIVAVGGFLTIRGVLQV